MNRPEPDIARLIASLAAQVASIRRSGLRLAGGAGQAAPRQKLPGETLQGVRSDLGNCSRCGLCRGRNTIVFGNGNPQARLVFVGLAPTPTDDAEGSPFCGAEGELLTKIIASIALTRADVYLTHIVKCAPPGARPPLAEEARTCLPFFFRQLAVIGPALVCALGEAAAQWLLETGAPLEDLRGRFHPFAGGLLLIPTYDPACLLLQQDKKRATWDDMKMIKSELIKMPPGHKGQG